MAINSRQDYGDDKPIKKWSYTEHVLCIARIIRDEVENERFVCRVTPSYSTNHVVAFAASRVSLVSPFLQPWQLFSSQHQPICLHSLIHAMVNWCCWKICTYCCVVHSWMATLTIETTSVTAIEICYQFLSQLCHACYTEQAWATSEYFNSLTISSFLEVVVLILTSSVLIPHNLRQKSWLNIAQQSGDASLTTVETNAKMSKSPKLLRVLMLTEHILPQWT